MHNMLGILEKRYFNHFTPCPGVTKKEFILTIFEKRWWKGDEQMKSWWTNVKLMRIKEWNMKTWIWEYCLFWHQIIGAKIIRNIWSTVKRIDLFILGVKWLSVYTLTLVCIFSTFFSIHFLWYWQGEFVWPSRAS